MRKIQGFCGLPKGLLGVPYTPFIARARDAFVNSLIALSHR